MAGSQRGLEVNHEGFLQAARSRMERSVLHSAGNAPLVKGKRGLTSRKTALKQHSLIRERGEEQRGRRKGATGREEGSWLLPHTPCSVSTVTSRQDQGLSLKGQNWGLNPEVALADSPLDHLSVSVSVSLFGLSPAVLGGYSWLSAHT